MSSQITHEQSTSFHLLADILETCFLIPVFGPFIQFTPPASRNASHPSSGDMSPERGREVRKKAGPIKIAF